MRGWKRANMSARLCWRWGNERDAGASRICAVGQYNHEPNIATLRFWMHEIGLDNLSDLQRLQMPAKRVAGNAALKLMDEHLAGREWFVGEHMTLADVCLFAYTHVAGDADFDLG